MFLEGWTDGIVLVGRMKPRCHARYHSQLSIWKMVGMDGASTSGGHSNQMIEKCYVNRHMNEFIIILCEIIKKYFKWNSTILTKYLLQKIPFFGSLVQA